ncbi:MAG: DUF5666 domain-containing protein [Pseudonocardiaceae bacterium]
MISRTKMTLLAGIAVLAIAGVGTGIAFAQSSDPPSPAPPTSSSAAPAPDDMEHGHGRHGGPLSRIVHGEATLTTKDHGYQVVDLQRGIVDSVNSGQLTVRSADGFTATYMTNNATKIRKGRESSDISQVLANDRVTVVATKTNGTATATRIHDGGPAK